MSKWKMVRLGDVFEKQITGEWGTECGVDDIGIKVLRTTNFTNLGIVDYSDVVTRKIDENKVSSKRLQHGDIILEKSGGSDTQPVGRVVYFDKSKDLYLCNNFTQALRTQKDIAHDRYIFYFMFYQHKIGATSLLQNKTTGIRNLQLKSYMKKIIPLPPLEEQKRITDILDKASNLIDLRKQQLEKMDLLIKSEFIDIFGDPVTNPKGWEKEKLGVMCEIITGNTPPRVDKENYGSYIEWIKSDNINTSSTILTTAEESLSEKGFEKARCVEAGSILMTCIAGSIGCIGNVAITNRNVAFNQQINAIVPGKNKSEFMYWLFILSKIYVQSTVNKSLKGILSKGKLSELQFIFPPIDLQTQFAGFVEQVEKQKAVMQQSLEKMETNYKALMQEYFG